MNRAIIYTPPGRNDGSRNNQDNLFHGDVILEAISKGQAIEISRGYQRRADRYK